MYWEFRTERQLKTQVLGLRHINGPRSREIRWHYSGVSHISIKGQKVNPGTYKHMQDGMKKEKVKKVGISVFQKKC